MPAEAGPGDRAEPLACPNCARRYPLSERFCRACQTPLVYVGRAEEEPITAADERARKVRPEYRGGGLVKVAWARNLAEAELIQGLLRDQGIPSTERRTRGFDVPDFLAAGPRDILVPRAAEAAARELLSEAQPADANGGAADGPSDGTPAPARLLAWLLVALAIAAALVFGLSQLTA